MHINPIAHHILHPFTSYKSHSNYLSQTEITAAVAISCFTLLVITSTKTLKDLFGNFSVLAVVGIFYGITALLKQNIYTISEENSFTTSITESSESTKHSKLPPQRRDRSRFSRHVSRSRHTKANHNSSDEENFFSPY